MKEEAVWQAKALRQEACCTSRAAILPRTVNCNTVLKTEKFGWFNFSSLGLQKR
jgi:hypothetical protein